MKRLLTRFLILGVLLVSSVLTLAGHNTSRRAGECGDECCTCCGYARTECVLACNGDPACKADCRIIFQGCLSACGACA